MAPRLTRGMRAGLRNDSQETRKQDSCSADTPRQTHPHPHTAGPHPPSPCSLGQRHGSVLRRAGPAPRRSLVADLGETLDGHAVAVREEREVRREHLIPGVLRALETHDLE